MVLQPDLGNRRVPARLPGLLLPKWQVADPEVAMGGMGLVRSLVGARGGIDDLPSHNTVVSATSNHPQPDRRAGAWRVDQRGHFRHYASRAHRGFVDWVRGALAQLS